MTERTRPTDDRLREPATEHLDYEVGMLAGLVERFQTIRAAIEAAGESEPEVPDYVTRCAYVDSFTMHTRNLVNFFYHPMRYPDDSIAGD